jgi:hypothetical protein
MAPTFDQLAAALRHKLIFDKGATCMTLSA